MIEELIDRKNLLEIAEMEKEIFHNTAFSIKQLEEMKKIERYKFFIIKIEENEFFYKKYVFYYTEKELQCFEKWCRSLKTNGKPMLDTVLEAVQFLNDESEQVQFLARLLSKVPFFNPIFPKAVMNDFDEMVKQKIDGIRKQKQNVEMLNDMFIRSIEEASFNVEVLSDMIYQKFLEE